MIISLPNSNFINRGLCGSWSGAGDRGRAGSRAGAGHGRLGPVCWRAAPDGWR